MILLSDGQVMVQEEATPHWHALTPDSHGSYINGTWSPLADMSFWRRYYASGTLRDGTNCADRRRTKQIELGKILSRLAVEVHDVVEMEEKRQLAAVRALNVCLHSFSNDLFPISVSGSPH
jgi:hypothetical protein